MFCRKCGRPLSSYSKYCAFCGTPAGDYDMDEGNGTEMKAVSVSGTGAAPLICGIFGLIFFWLVVPGFVLGAIALALGLGMMKRGPEYARSKAVAGVVLGVTAFALSTLTVALLIWGAFQVPDMSGMPVYTI